MSNRTTSEVYLDVVGQLLSHQVVEFFFTQGGGSILTGVHLELGDKSVDGSFHDETWRIKKERKISTNSFHTSKKSQIVLAQVSPFVFG